MSDLPQSSPDFVQKIIQKEKVVIFSKSYCPFCQLAKKQFEKCAQKATVIEVNESRYEKEIMNALEEITGERLVPRVFVNGKFIGGGTDVKKMYEEGDLQTMLREGL